MVFNKAPKDTPEQNGYSTDETCDETSSNNIGYGLIEICAHIAKSCDFNRVRKALKNTGVLNHCIQCDKESNIEVLSPENELDTAIEFDETLWIW